MVEVDLFCVCRVMVYVASARHTIIARREFIITASALIVTLPLSLYRNITRLVKVRPSVSLSAPLDSSSLLLLLLLNEEIKVA